MNKFIGIGHTGFHIEFTLPLELPPNRNMLSESEKQQYSRQMMLPGYGKEKQALLKQAHVMVIGLGGLGIPVAHYLAAAGIGSLTLIDHDIVELHNLHRQPLFGVHDVGQLKVAVAAHKLKQLYPHISIQSICKRFDTNSSSVVPKRADIIADCTDNFHARYAIDTYAFEHKTPVLFGAVHRNEGRLSLFHAKTKTRYIDAYPTAPVSAFIRDCEEEGVLGPLAGVIGSMMAATILTFLVTGESELDGAMLHVDARDFKTTKFSIPTTKSATTVVNTYTTLEPHSANAQLIRSGHYELIDVREWHEHEEYNIGGACRPAGNVREWAITLSNEKTTLLYCNHGYQSSAVAQYISTLIPELTIAHLQGGLQAWSELLLKGE